MVVELLLPASLDTYTEAALCVCVEMCSMWEVVVVHLWHPLYSTLHSDSAKPG